MKKQITIALIVGVFLSWMLFMLLEIRPERAFGRIVFILVSPGITTAFKLWGMDSGATKLQNDSTVVMVNALIYSAVCFGVLKVASRRRSSAEPARPGRTERPIS